MSRLGSTVRKLREQRGLSMHELASKTNLRAAYIRRLEQGKEMPKTEEVRALARELGASNLLTLIPKLDENLIVYLNNNYHVVALVKAIASSSLKENEINELRQHIEEQNLGHVLFLLSSAPSSKEVYEPVKKLKKQ